MQNHLREKYQKGNNKHKNKMKQKYCLWYPL